MESGRKNSGIVGDEEASWLNLDASSIVSSWTHANERVLRETNKALRRIYDDHKIEYGADVPPGIDGEKELAKRTLVALKLREENVKDVLKRMKAAKNLDLCFLVDVTGSMVPYIDGVKNAIRSIVDQLTTNNDLPAKTAAPVGKSVTFSGLQPIIYKIRLAFVGYRDMKDTPQFEVLNFTDSVDHFHCFCSSILAKGGDDEAEDVFGGLEKSVELRWTTDGTTRILFHIADAPCHGREYHKISSDSYPGGDPKGRSINSLLGQLADNGVQYHFGKINDTTDLMVAKFSAIYGENLMVCDIKDAGHILDGVVSMTSMAVAGVGSSHRSKKFSGRFDPSEPSWSELAVINGRLFSYELPKSIDAILSGVPLKAKQPKKCKIKMAKDPFASGVERVAYYGRDVTLLEHHIGIVLKKYIGPRNTFINSSSHYEAAIQLQTTAAYLASLFTDLMLKKIGHGYAIKFLKTQVLSYVEGGRMFMSCEKCYPPGYKYLRFTNNMDYFMLEITAQRHGLDLEFVKQLLAFSHWTYQVSKGYFMVTDLQGIISNSTDGGHSKSIELTDPAIHCTDLTRFGQTNHGIEGMKSFFSRHKCNEFCKQLGLNSVNIHE